MNMAMSFPLASLADIATTMIAAVLCSVGLVVYVIVYDAIRTRRLNATAPLVKAVCEKYGATEASYSDRYMPLSIKSRLVAAEAVLTELEKDLYRVGLGRFKDLRLEAQSLSEELDAICKYVPGAEELAQDAEAIRQQLDNLDPQAERDIRTLEAQYDREARELQQRRESRIAAVKPRYEAMRKELLRSQELLAGVRKS